MGTAPPLGFEDREVRRRLLAAYGDGVLRPEVLVYWRGREVVVVERAEDGRRSVSSTESMGASEG